MSDDEVGSVAEEAAKLLDALQGWARGAGGDHSGAAAGSGGSLGDRLRDVGDHIGHGPDCRYCPVCQTINFFRDTSPEAKEKVVAAAGALMTSVAELLAGLVSPPDQEPEQAPEEAPGQAPEEAPGQDTAGEPMDDTDDGRDES